MVEPIITDTFVLKAVADCYAKGEHKTEYAEDLQAVAPDGWVRTCRVAFRVATPDVAVIRETAKRAADVLQAQARDLKLRYVVRPEPVSRDGSCTMVTSESMGVAMRLQAFPSLEPDVKVYVVEVVGVPEAAVAAA